MVQAANEFNRAEHPEDEAVRQREIDRVRSHPTRPDTKSLLFPIKTNPEGQK